MTMTTKTSITEKAKALGGNAADAYYNEFEVSPADDGKDSVGDWDMAAWEGHWHELKDSGATDADYETCLEAWRQGFWGAAR
jgi:hypothetical protein